MLLLDVGPKSSPIWEDTKAAIINLLTSKVCLPQILKTDDLHVQGWHHLPTPQVGFQASYVTQMLFKASHEVAVCLFGTAGDLIPTGVQYTDTSCKATCHLYVMMHSPA